MANPRPLLLLLLPLLLLSAPLRPLMAAAAPLTAYDLLEHFGFPRGILPVGVTSYLLREDSTFELYLGDRLGDCTFQVEGGYQLKYERKITGTVEYGALKDIKGVSVKVLFVWFGISEVVRNDDELNFYVGPLSASFPLDNFEDCPRCGCGFDCVTEMVAEAAFTDS